MRRGEAEHLDLEEALGSMEHAQNAPDIWTTLGQAGQRVGLGSVRLVTRNPLDEDHPVLMLAATGPDLPSGLSFELSPERLRPACLPSSDEVSGEWSAYAVPVQRAIPPEFGTVSFSGPHPLWRLREMVEMHGPVLCALAQIGFARYRQLIDEAKLNAAKLSRKQTELLSLIGLGLPDKQIAEQLGVSVSAVRQRLNLLMSNAGVSSRTDVAQLAMCAGLVPHPVGRALAVAAE